MMLKMIRVQGKPGPPLRPHLRIGTREIGCPTQEGCRKEVIALEFNCETVFGVFAQLSIRMSQVVTRFTISDWLKHFA